MRKKADAKTLLFVDEIHRFNRSQQDAFLPNVEDGTVTLLGATTENPLAALNTPLLSRCRMFAFEALTRNRPSGIVTARTRRPRRFASLHLAADSDALQHFIARL
jgi:putative ATPase